MSGVVVLDIDRFRTRYPQAASVTDDRLMMAFDDAGFYLNNTVASPVSDLKQREYLLGLIMMHLLYLDGSFTAEGAGSTAGQVGVLSSASEGSVSASFAVGAVDGSSAWWKQTQYGNTYWQATSRFRRFRYVPPCP